MKRFKQYVLPSLLILLLFGSGVAVTQNINKSVQLSQDPTGPIGIDTNNNVYFPAHVLNTSTGTPAVTGCGVSPTITGTDTAGIVTAGTVPAAGCVITFNKAYLAAPYCVVAAQNPGTSPLAWTTSLTAITITSADSATIFNYICSGATK